VIFGLGRYGSEIAKVLQGAGVRPFGVDFDPETLRLWKNRGLPGMYGDAADPDLISSLPLKGARWAIIAMPPAAATLTHSDARIVLINAMREAGFSGTIMMRSQDAAEEDRLREAGADIVLSPFADAAVRAGEFLGIHPSPE
jgi:Trk K+ transport system NAD-binding subunit